MKKKVYKKRISIAILLLMVFSIVSLWNVEISYGADNPNATVYVHGNTDAGPVFSGDGNMGGGLWAPGVTKSGTLRIMNNYPDRVQVGSLGLSMKLEKLQEEEYQPVNDKELYKLFAQSMKLTIKKGRLLVFNATLFDKSFYEMLYQKDSDTYKGYPLPALDKFNINSGDHADLQYTVHMDESAGNELQGVKATVAFIINSTQNPVPYEPGDSDDSGSSEPNKPSGNDGKDTNGHWAHDCIKTLIEKGVIKGYPDNTIRPENYVTRAEAAALVGRALKLEVPNKTSASYVDFIPDWAAGWISVTSEKGIFEGYPGKKFKSNQYITREEMTKVLVKAFDKKLNGALELTFNDREKISAWALQYVKAGVQNKAIEGYPDNSFKPGANMTRAETFTLICKLLGYHEEHVRVD